MALARLAITLGVINVGTFIPPPPKKSRSYLFDSTNIYEALTRFQTVLDAGDTAENKTQKTLPS